jgi:vacuolar-type H+-ATPase subunit H
MEEYEKRNYVLRAKCSSTITSTKNTAWDEITEAMNSHNPSVKRNMKEIQKKWDNICSSAKTEFSHKKKNAEKNRYLF